MQRQQAFTGVVSIDETTLSLQRPFGTRRALPEAADFHIAVSGNSDREHFTLKKAPVSTLLLVFFSFRFQATCWTLSSAVPGTRKEVQKGLVIKDSL